MKNQNRRSRKRASIRKMKRQYARMMHHYGSLRDYEAHRDDWDDGRYWDLCYISGSRRIGKEETNRAIRRMYRDMPRDEDAIAFRHGDYIKIFDYDWIVW